MVKNYIRLQLEDELPFINKFGGLLKFLFILMRDADYPSTKRKDPYSSVNRIRITISTKTAWAIELDLSVASINNFITELVKSKIMVKEDVGSYLLNPSFAYKGPTSLEDEAVEQYGEGKN